MDHDAGFARQYASLESFVVALGAGSARGSAIELDGVRGAIEPSVPDRSFFNSVTYRDPDALGAALPALARAYEHAGVLAWTVWADERDGRAAALLEEAGHVLDAEPRAMIMDLDRLVTAPEPIELTPEPDHAAFADVMERSYGLTPGAVTRAWRELPPGFHRYLAFHEGKPACCLATFDVDGDAILSMVGTVPEARGRGLAYALTHRALSDARDRGMATTTLQATKMGRPVYERLGYQDLGAVLMWERRKPA